MLEGLLFNIVQTFPAKGDLKKSLEETKTEQSAKKGRKVVFRKILKSF